MNGLAGFNLRKTKTKTKKQKTKNKNKNKKKNNKNKKRTCVYCHKACVDIYGRVIYIYIQGIPVANAVMKS